MKRFSFIFLLGLGLLFTACESTDDCDTTIVDGLTEELKEAINNSNAALGVYLQDETDAENCERYKTAIEAVITARTNLFGCSSETAIAQLEADNEDSQREIDGLTCN